MTIYTRYRAAMQTALGEVILDLLDTVAPLDPPSEVGTEALVRLESKRFTLTRLPVDDHALTNAARALLDLLDSDVIDRPQTVGEVVASVGRYSVAFDEAKAALRGLVDGQPPSDPVTRASEIHGIVSSALNLLHENLLDAGSAEAQQEAWADTAEALTAEIALRALADDLGRLRVLVDDRQADRCVVIPETGSVLHRYACDFGPDCPAPGGGRPAAPTRDTVRALFDAQQAKVDRQKLYDDVFTELSMFEGYDGQDEAMGDALHDLTERLVALSAAEPPRETAGFIYDPEADRWCCIACEQWSDEGADVGTIAHADHSGVAAEPNEEPEQ